MAGSKPWSFMSPRVTTQADGSAFSGLLTKEPARPRRRNRSPSRPSWPRRRRPRQKYGDVRWVRSQRASPAPAARGPPCLRGQPAPGARGQRLSVPLAGRPRRLDHPRSMVAAWVAEHDGEVAGHVALVRGLNLECLLRATGLPLEALGGIVRL